MGLPGQFQVGGAGLGFVLVTLFLSGGEACLDLLLSLTFFRATNSFSALARNPTSSSYLDEKD